MKSSESQQRQRKQPEETKSRSDYYSKFGNASRGKYFGVTDKKKKIEGCNRRSTSRRIIVASNYYNEYLPRCWGGAMANTSSVVLVSNFYHKYLPNCGGGAMANKSIAACSCISCLKNGSIICCLNCSANTSCSPAHVAIAFTSLNVQKGRRINKLGVNSF